MTTAEQIEKYGAQGLQTAGKYGTAFAAEAYNVSKDLAYTAGTEMYNAANYVQGRAAHYSTKKVTIKQIVLVIILAGIAYLAYQEYSKKQKGSGSSSSSNPINDIIASATTPTASKPTAAVSTYDSVVNENKLLKKGDKSINTKTLQTELNNLGEKLYVDGIFGSLTEAALVRKIGKKETTINNFRSEIAAKAATPNDTPTPAPAPAPQGLDNNKVLKKGVEGAEVKKLQEGLNLQGEKLTADGKFGRLTEAAVKRVTGRLGTPKSEITLTYWYSIQSSL